MYHESNDERDTLFEKVSVIGNASYQDEIARKELGYGKEGERLYRFPKGKIYEKNKGVQNK